MTIQLNLSNIPEEVTEYAFDQFSDRLQGPEWDDALETTLTSEPVEMDYDEQAVTIHRTVITTVLQTAMYEKIRDIEWELEHGERNDYDVSDIKSMRAAVDAAV